MIVTTKDRIFQVIRNDATRHLVVLTTSLMMAVAGGSMIIPLMVVLQQQYTRAPLGVIEAAFVGVSTIATVLWGIIIDRVKNRKTLFLVFFTMWLIPCWLLGLLRPSTIEAYAALRLSMALGIGGVHPTVTSYLGDVIPPSRRSTLSSLNAIAILIGTGFGILIGGFTGERDAFIPFLVLALLGTTWLVPTSIIFPELPRGLAETEVQAALQRGVTYHFVLSREDLQLIVRQKSNFFLLFQGWLALIPSGMLTYYLVAFFSDSNHGGLGYPLALATVLGLGFASGRFFGYVCFGFLGDKAKRYHANGPVIVAALSTFIQAPLLVLSFSTFTPRPFSASTTTELGLLDLVPLFLFSPDLLVFGILLFLTTFCGAGSAPNRQALMYDVNVPETRAVVSALYGLMDQVGLSLGILLGSIFIDLWGYGSAFSVATIGWMLSALTWSLAVFTYPRDRHVMHQLLQQRLNHVNGL